MGHDHGYPPNSQALAYQGRRREFRNKKLTLLFSIKRGAANGFVARGSPTGSAVVAE
jgi:hypothetical protein